MGTGAPAGRMGARPAPDISGQPQRADIRWRDMRYGEFDHVDEIPVEQSAARVNRPANRLIFTQHDIHLWVEAGHADDREAYRIGGLDNPTLVVPVGAHLTVVLLNLNFTTVVQWEFSAHGPPFPEGPGGPNHWRQLKIVYDGDLSPMVAPRGPSVIYYARMEFDVRSPGEAWYLPRSKGAGDIGFFGRVLVVP